MKTRKKMKQKRKEKKKKKEGRKEEDGLESRMGSVIVVLDLCCEIHDICSLSLNL